MKQALLAILYVLISSLNIISQSIPAEGENYYQMGKQAILKNDVINAEKFFKRSIKENDDSKSMYELAKISYDKNTIQGRTQARELLTNAIFKEPKNLKYRYLLADVYKKFSSRMAYGIYKDIIRIDSTSVEALYNLGKIDAVDFNDYHNSVMSEGEYETLSFEKYAQESFRSAREYLEKAIRYDSTNKEAYLHLSFLFEDNGKIPEGIRVLKKAEQIFPEDKNVHLYLGLLYYENSRNDSSFREYQLALSLMPDSERTDFTFNTVKEILKPALGDKFKKYTDDQLKDIINYFWNISDPLYLTDYNERLLEHYSRVAYADLRFSIPKEHIPGWKTDRGEMVLRYGEPLKRVLFRPYINAGGSTQISMKTDVWYYKYFTIGFTDQFLNGNFVFSEPLPGDRFIPQYGGDSPMLADYLRRVQFQIYTPKFEGPEFKVPYDIIQFKSNEYNYTDVYLNYGIEAEDSLRTGNYYREKYNWGLFYFDSLHDPIFSDKGEIDSISALHKVDISRGKNILVNSLNMSVYPDSGELAFELERESDHGVSSNHIPFYPRKFKLKNLDVSAIILASKLLQDTSNTLPLRRYSYSILPNPSCIFSVYKPIYVYYELYNLNVDKNEFNDFEQKLIVKKKDESSGLSKTINSVLNVVGLGKQKEEVTITTKYQMRGNSVQVNFQLDMHKYKPGDYTLTFLITDLISGKEISEDVSLTLK